MKTLRFLRAILLAVFLPALLSCAPDNSEDFTYRCVTLPPLPAGARYQESHYRDALVYDLRVFGCSAEKEVKCDGGRCDILTDKYAIEVDRARKWHEAIGQAVHYSIALNRKPCIAIYDFDKLSPENMHFLIKVCSDLKIKVVFIIGFADVNRE